jgi:hypothetical protein
MLIFIKARQGWRRELKEIERLSGGFVDKA